MRWTITILLVATLAFAGCGGYQPAARPPSTQPTAKAPAPAPAPAQSPAPKSGMTAGMTAIGAAAGLAPLETAVQGPMGVAPKAGSPPPVQSGASYQKADVGSGKRGRGYGGGLVTQPVATFFASKEMIAFRIQIPDAMRLYKAENGNAPKTHQEFMQKIIAPGRIPLPDLPEGHSYKYDPATEQLMVEHPAP